MGMIKLISMFGYRITTKREVKVPKLGLRYKNTA